MKTFIFWIFLFVYCYGQAQYRWFKHLPGWRAKSTLVKNDTLLTCGMNSWEDKFGQKLGTFLTLNSIKGDSIGYFKISLDSLEKDSSRSTTISYKYASSVLIDNQPAFFLGLSYGDKKERAFLFKSDNFKTKQYSLKEYTVDTFHTYLNNLIYTPMCKILFIPYVFYSKPLETDVNTIIYKESKAGIIKIKDIKNTYSEKYETLCHIKDNTSDKNFFFILLYMTDYAGSPRVWQDYIVKMDTMGNELWRVAPSNRDSINPEGMQMVQKPNGNLLVSWCDYWYRPYKNPLGSQQPQGNDNCTVWFAEIDVNGKVLWRKNIKWFLTQKIARNNYENLFHSKVIAVKDGVIWSGNYSYYYDHNYLLKTDFDGNPKWYREYELYPSNTVRQEFKSYDVTSTSDGGYVLTGEYISYKGNIFPNGCQLATIIKVDSFGCLLPGCQKADSIPISIKPTKYLQHCKVYPNPANEAVTIQLPFNKKGIYLLEVYSITGKLIEKLAIPESTELNTAKYPVGFYLFKLYNEQSYETHKISISR